MKELQQKMQALWKSLRTRNSFVQNSAWLFSASALATLVQFIFFPILSRIYDPEAYGIFGLFSALVSNLSILAGMHLSRAFVLPESDEKFKALLQVSLRSTLFISAATLAITLIAGPALLELFGAEKMGAYIYLAAPVVFLMAFDRILIDWAIRLKSFRKFATFNVQSVVVSKLFNVFYGLKVSNTSSGLVLSHVLHYLGRLVLYLKFIIGDERKLLFSRASSEERKAVIREYRNFPLYLLPGNFLNGFSNLLPVWLLPLFGLDIAAVGIYTFSLIALDLPVKLLSSAIGPVFLQKAAETRHKGDSALGALSERLFLNLTLIAFPIVLVLFSFGQPLYGLVFGEQWLEAGLIAELLALSYFFRLSSSPVSAVLSVIKKEKQMLGFQVLLFIMRVLGLTAGYFMGNTLMDHMLCYTVVNAVAYFVLGIWVFVLLEHSFWKPMFIKLLSFGILLTLGLGIKAMLFG